MSLFQPPKGVHLVGSVSLSSATEVFTTVTKTLPGRLHSLPDGETGKRDHFVRWQYIVLAENYPELAIRAVGPELSEDQLSEILSKLNAEGGLRTHYDTYALESYQTFSELRAAGIIPSRTKLQICLPTPQNLCLVVREPYRVAMEPLYHKAVLSDLKHITSSIPSQDLLIQWDCAREFAILEDRQMPYYSIGFTTAEGETDFQSITRRLVELVDAVDPSVETGLHCCYGDNDHKHFIQPRDLRTIVDLVNAVTHGLRRGLTYVHMPVPINRDDDEYFEPLRELCGDLKVFLGLVHPNDLTGTERRIEVAQKVVPDLNFGLATECGLGREPREQIQAILEQMAEVSSVF